MSPQGESTRVGGPRICPIANALDIVGDRWALLVLRELSFGVHRFTDIRANTGAPRDSVTTRLRELRIWGESYAR